MKAARTLALALVAGCLLLAVPAAAAPVGMSDEEVQGIATPLCDSVLKGLATGDYALYSKDFDAMLKSAISEDMFKKTSSEINEQLGTCTGKEYLGFLTKGQMTMALWKARFSKSTDDVLIKLLATNRDGRDLVTGLWFE